VRLCVCVCVRVSFGCCEYVWCVYQPLAFTGQEYVWGRLFTELGVTEDEPQRFFVGPGVFVWERKVRVLCVCVCVCD